MKNLLAFLGLFTVITQAHGYTSEDNIFQNESGRTITIAPCTEEAEQPEDSKTTITSGETKGFGPFEFFEISISLDDGTLQKKTLKLKKTEFRRIIRITDPFIRNQFDLNK